MTGESGQVNKDVFPIVYDIRNNQWTTKFKRNTDPGVTEPDIPLIPAVGQASQDSTTNTIAMKGGVAGAVMVVVALVGLFFYRRFTSGKGIHDKKNTDTIIGHSVREPQSPGGDPEAELLGASHPLSPPPIYSRPMYFDQDDLIRYLAASPPIGPHSVMKDPQVQKQQHQQYLPMSGDGNDFERPSNGHHRPNHQPSFPTSPRSPQAVHCTSVAQRDCSSNGDDDKDNDEHQREKIIQPLLPSPRNPQVAAKDGQNGLLRGPQWQSSIHSVVVSDQR